MQSSGDYWQLLGAIITALVIAFAKGQASRPRRDQQGRDLGPSEALQRFEQQQAAASAERHSRVVRWAYKLGRRVRRLRGLPD